MRINVMYNFDRSAVDEEYTSYKETVNVYTFVGAKKSRNFNIMNI